jgi:hypothetical protein
MIGHQGIGGASRETSAVHSNPCSKSTVAIATATATMKVTALALLPLFCATSAFGLNGAAQSVAKSTRSLGFTKKSPALVQPMDINGNRLNTMVSVS